MHNKPQIFVPAWAYDDYIVSWTSIVRLKIVPAYNLFHMSLLL